MLQKCRDGMAFRLHVTQVASFREMIQEPRGAGLNDNIRIHCFEHHASLQDSRSVTLTSPNEKYILFRIKHSSMKISTREQAELLSSVTPCVDTSPGIRRHHAVIVRHKLHAGNACSAHGNGGLWAQLS